MFSMTETQKPIRNMDGLIEQIRTSISYYDMFSECGTMSPDKTRWFRQVETGVWQFASPTIFGTRILAENDNRTARIHFFWVDVDSMQFDNMSAELITKKLELTKAPSPPQPGDMFTYAFGGVETIFTVTKVSYEADDDEVLRIEAEPVDLPPLQLLAFAADRHPFGRTKFPL
jgi:hypothetical protein